MNRSAPLIVGALLALAHLALAAWDLSVPRHAPVTYVFTPLVDVWPEGPALSPEEGQALGRSLRHGVDARRMSEAYGRLGATLSLAELLAGIDGLQGDLAPTGRQAAELATLLDAARADHAALVEVQGQILDLEATIAQRVGRLQPSAPPPPQLGPPPGAP